LGVKGALSTTNAILTHTIIAFNVNIVNSIIKYMKIVKLKTSQIPKRINQLNDCPEYLNIKTELVDPLELFKLPAVAIVGSRKLTAYGKAVTEKIVAELVAKGVVIVSGLALGIDSVAHQQAINNRGKTIAVLPCGVNNIYPRSHLNIASQIAKEGALISEYHPDEKVAYKHNFIARNRIIAGLSDIIVIPEAAKGSGSLHTAQFGIDLGIDIFAVPGPIFSPNSEGTNNLIKSGAYLLNSKEELLSKLGFDSTKKQKKLPLLDSPEQMNIAKVLLRGPAHFEYLLEKTKMPSSDLNSNLSYLEIMGVVRNVGNNNWELI
jgi:DNA processing protein